MSKQVYVYLVETQLLSEEDNGIPEPSTFCADVSAGVGVVFDGSELIVLQSKSL